jgi:hypothetical protein
MTILRRPIFESRAVVVALQPAANDERTNEQENEKKNRNPGREGNVQQHSQQFSVSSSQFLENSAKVARKLETENWKL